MIVVLKMGVSGAGWATVISQLVSGVLCLIYMAKRFEILRLKKDDLKPEWYYIGRLCAAGLPMGLQYSITAIGSILLQTAVNGLGPSYMAAVTAGNKVSQLLCCPIDAMGSTMATYGGQNIGAGKIERVKKGLLDCSLLGICWSVMALGIAALFGGNLAMLFVNKNDVQSAADIPQILSFARQFLVINASFYIPLAFVNIVRFLIQGMGFSQIAVYAGVFELAARGLFGLWLVPVLGYNAVCFANPTAWILADLFLFPTYFACYRKLKRRTG